MTLTYLVLFIKDMDTSLGLYRDVLGLEVERRYPTDDGGEAAFLVEKGFRPMIDQPMLELVVEPSGHYGPASGYLIGFTVESLEKSSALMEQKGLKKIRGPYSPDPSVQISTFEGPDKEIIELMQNL